MNHKHLECDKCCLECSGPSKGECDVGECDTENSCYPMYNEIIKCIYGCSSLPPLYIDTSGSQILCKPCHADCTLCSGISNIQCLECRSPILLTDQHECLYNNCDNYPNTFQTDVKCEKCSEKCNGCVFSPTFCLDCVDPYIFHSETNSCLTTCPDQFYHYIPLRECLSKIIYIHIYIYI